MTNTAKKRDAETPTESPAKLSAVPNHETIAPAELIGKKFNWWAALFTNSYFFYKGYYKPAFQLAGAFAGANLVEVITGKPLGLGFQLVIAIYTGFYAKNWIRKFHEEGKIPETNTGKNIGMIFAGILLIISPYILNGFAQGFSQSFNKGTHTSRA